jgi:hypothetical protein
MLWLIWKPRFAMKIISFEVPPLTNPKLAPVVKVISMLGVQRHVSVSDNVKVAV